MPCPRSRCFLPISFSILAKHYATCARPALGRKNHPLKEAVCRTENAPEVLCSCVLEQDSGANTGQTSAALSERNVSYDPRPRVTLRSSLRSTLGQGLLRPRCVPRG